MLLKDVLLPSSGLRKLKLAPEKTILGPIRQPSITFIHATSGVGKTFFVMELALSAISGESKFNTTKTPPAWRPGSKLRALFIDGEMPMADLQERVNIQRTGRDDSGLTFLSNVDYNRRTGKNIDITDAGCRLEIEQAINTLDADVLILDNLTTLTSPSFNEDSSSAQRALNLWWSRLRDAGCSVIFVHHDNKSKDQRGSSDRTTVCDLIIHLVKPIDADPTRAIMDVRFSKFRGNRNRPKPFHCRFLANRWHFSSEEQSTMEQLLWHMEATNEWDWRTLTIELGISKSQVYRLREKARQLGIWEERWDESKAENTKRLKGARR